MKKRDMKKCLLALCEKGTEETKINLARCCPEDILWELAEDDSVSVRCEVVKRRNKGLLLDIIMSDDDPLVLAEVARTGFALAILARHKNPVVRKGVCEGITRDNFFERKLLEKLLADPEPSVRAAALEKTLAMFGRRIEPYYEDAPEVRRVLLDLNLKEAS